MANTVWSPFSDDQVNSLNAYQEAKIFHPFTCQNDSHPTLVANNDGWFCTECDYHNQWAYTWMADWSWKDMFRKYF